LSNHDYLIAGGAVAGAVYLALWVQIWLGISRQNFPTWTLWAIMDGITAASIILQSGNYILPAVYATGSLITAASIFIKTRTVKWTWVETMVVTLVIACFVVWRLSGPRMATIAGTIAVIIAGIPQAIDMWKRPWESSFLAYLGFFVANALSTFGGKDWSIEERFYPGLCAVFCLIIVAVIARKFWMPEETNKNPG